jgi:hypothetical protein
MNARLPVVLAGGAVVMAQPGECEVCGPRGQVMVAAVGRPVGEVVACPACTRFGARWLRAEVAEWFAPAPGSGGDVA